MPRANARTSSTKKGSCEKKKSSGGEPEGDGLFWKYTCRGEFLHKKKEWPPGRKKRRRFIFRERRDDLLVQRQNLPWVGANVELGGGKEEREPLWVNRKKKTRYTYSPPRKRGGFTRLRNEGLGKATRPRPAVTLRWLYKETTGTPSPREREEKRERTMEAGEKEKLGGPAIRRLGWGSLKKGTQTQKRRKKKVIRSATRNVRKGVVDLSTLG